MSAPDGGFQAAQALMTLLGAAGGAAVPSPTSPVLPSLQVLSPASGKMIPAQPPSTLVAAAQAATQTGPDGHNGGMLPMLQGLQQLSQAANLLTALQGMHPAKASSPATAAALAIADGQASQSSLARGSSAESLNSEPSAAKAGSLLSFMSPIKRTATGAGLSPATASDGAHGPSPSQTGGQDRPGKRARAPDPNNRPGVPRFFTGANSAVEQCKTLLEKNMCHCFQDLTKNFNKPIEAHIKNCKEKIENLAQRDSTHPDAQVLMTKLELGALVCEAHYQINASFLLFQLKGEGLKCLSDVAHVIETMDSQPLCRDQWAGGYYVPPYQREHLALFKLQHLLREGCSNPKDVAKLINSDAVDKIAAPHVLERLYQKPPQYIASCNIHPGQMRSHWDGNAIQHRLFCAFLSQLSAHAESGAALVNLLCKLFGDDFKELSAEGVGGSLQRRQEVKVVEGKSQKTFDPNAECDESSDESENAFEADLDVVPEDVKAQRSQAKLIISEDLAAQLREVLALLMPAKFGTQAARVALNAFDSSATATSARERATLMRSVVSSKIVRALVNETRTYVKQCELFNAWLDKSSAKMKAVTELHSAVCKLLEECDTTHGVVPDKMLTSAVAWHSKNKASLNALTEGNAVLEEQARLFSDPAIISLAAGALTKCENTILGTAHMLCVIAVRLGIAGLELSKAEATKTSSKVIVIKSCQTVSLACIGAVAALPLATKVNRTTRVLQVQSMLAHTFTLRIEHLSTVYDENGAMVGQDGQSAQLQESFMSAMPSMSSQYLQFLELWDKMDWAFKGTEEPAADGSLATSNRLLDTMLVKPPPSQEMAAWSVLQADHDLRCQAMLPFKANAYKRFLETKGPCTSCLDTKVKKTFLFPSGVWPELHLEIQSKTASPEQHGGDSTAAGRINALLDKVSHLATLHTDAAPAHRPDDSHFQTAMSMSIQVAQLQQASAKCVLGCGGGETQGHDFIAENLKSALKQLKSVIGDSAVFEPNADSVLLRFSSTGLSQQDIEVAELVKPTISAFHEVLDNAREVMKSIAGWAVAKASASMDSKVMHLKGLYFNNFRTFWEPSTRDVKIMKKKMKKNPYHHDIQKTADALQGFVEKLEAGRIEGVLDVTSEIEKGSSAADDAGMYIATAGVMNCLVFKAAEDLEASQLAKDCRICVSGLQKLGRWISSSTGPKKEIIGEALSLSACCRRGHGPCSRFIFLDDAFAVCLIIAIASISGRV